LEELCALWQGTGEVGRADGLRAVRAGGHEDVRKLGDEGGDVAGSIVLFKSKEEAADGGGGMKAGSGGHWKDLQQSGLELKGTLVLYQVLTEKSTSMKIPGVKSGALASNVLIEAAMNCKGVEIALTRNQERLRLKVWNSK